MRFIVPDTLQGAESLGKRFIDQLVAMGVFETEDFKAIIELLNKLLKV